MKKTYYGVFRRSANEQGEVIEILKDPDFCRDGEKPFETFITKDDTFLPWETTYKHTAEAQAELLANRDGMTYFVWKRDFDYHEFLKNQIEEEFVKTNE